MENKDLVGIRVEVETHIRISLRYIQRRTGVDYRDILSNLVEEHLWEKIKALESELKRKKVSPVPKPLREKILKESNGKCAYCNEPAYSLDHVIPRIHEGCTNERSNLVACCQRCNSIAGGTLFKNFEEKQKYVYAQVLQYKKWKDEYESTQGVK